MKPAITALLLLATPAFAEVGLAPVFGDHMVLQRDMPVPVWGTAEPGSRITVSFAGQSKTVEAGKDGRWRVALDPMEACADPREMRVRSPHAARHLSLTDVLVGEVWIGAGQSNMAWDMARTGFAKRELPEAENPLVRYFTNNGSAKPKFPGAKPVASHTWTPMSKATCANCSANMFFFGVRLQKRLKIPVGMMIAARGFTSSAYWTPQNVLGADPRCRAALERYREILDQFAKVPLRMPDNNARKLVPRPLTAKDTRERRNTGGPGYNRIRSWRPFALRGVCWNQGFSGSGHPGLNLLASTAAMIDAWRRDWGRKPADLPFLVVQKPPGAGDRGLNARTAYLLEPGTPVLDLGRTPRQNWELGQQLQHVHIANNMDLPGGMHPARKDATGYRLADQALAHVYGKEAPYRSPVVKTCAFRGSRAILTCKDAGDGLKTSDGKPLRGFFLAAADRVFFPAEATIVAPDTVQVQAEAVAEPAIVLYGNIGRYGNLQSSDGLLAFPYRSQPWAMPDPKAVETRVWPVFRQSSGQIQVAAGLVLWQLGIREADSIGVLRESLGKALPGDRQQAVRLMRLLARHVEAGEEAAREAARAAFNEGLRKAGNDKRFTFTLRKFMQYRVGADAITELLGRR